MRTFMKLTSSLMIYNFPFYISFMFFTACLISFLKPVHSKTLDSDIDALHSLQRAVDPISVPASSFLNTWDFEMDPCESAGSLFLGVLCTIPLDNSSKRVTAINLDRAGYDGFLPPEMGNLTELTILNLSKNNFRGPIPDTISNLQKLTELTLSENVFTGTIPTGISRLRMLRSLNLSKNKFSGSIPRGILGFRNLIHLGLSSNEIEGTLPDLRGLWQLNTLDLSNNQHYGSLPRLPNSLRTLSLSHNILSGQISSLRNLEQLQTLDISDNRFSGAITEDIIGLPELTHINISMNRFRTIRVGDFSDRQLRLHDFDAQKNSLRGHLPSTLATIKNLTAVNFAYNQFSGPIPKEYGAKLGRPWTSLFLDHNFLVGGLPPELSNSVEKKKITGSLANNCLKCPKNVQLCHGEQRPASECTGQTKDRD